MPTWLTLSFAQTSVTVGPHPHLWLPAEGGTLTSSIRQRPFNGSLSSHGHLLLRFSSTHTAHEQSKSTTVMSPTSLITAAETDVLPKVHRACPEPALQEDTFITDSTSLEI